MVNKSLYHAARVNVSRNAFFSSRSEKKIIFFDVGINVVKNKSKCGFSWYVLLSITSTRHYIFPKHFFELFLHIKPRPNNRNMPQHCWAQHVACVWPPCWDVLRHVGCCWLKFENGQIWANNTQQVATFRNTVAKLTQHVAPNNVATCCVGMLRSFGRGFKVAQNSFLFSWDLQN